MCFLVTLEPIRDQCPFESEICSEMHAITELMYQNIC